MKTKILVVEDDDEISELLAFIIGSNLDVDIAQAHSGSSAIEYLKTHSDVSLVLSDLNMPGGSGIDIFNFLKTQKKEIPIAFMSGDDLDQHPELKSRNLKSISKPFSSEQVISLIKEMTPQISLENKNILYIPVKLTLLLKMKDITTPLYVKINEQKFVRLTHQKFEFDEEFLKKYQTKNIDHLYIESLEAQDFIAEFEKKTLSSLAWKETPFDKSTEAIKLNTELLHELSEQLGWNEDIINLAEGNVYKALAIAQSNPDLKLTLEQFKKIEKFGYADHCVMLVVLCSGLAFKLSMGDEYTLRRLTFAALFHDMTLTDEQYRNKENSLKLFHKRESQPNNSFKDLLTHPARAAELCRHWNFCPGAVDTIIFQHHEDPDGTGFPMGKNGEELHELSCLFIICEDFVNFYTESIGKPDLQNFIRSRALHYKRGHFKKYFAAFADMLMPAVQIAS